MAEKAKKRILPWVVAIIVSAFLAISGASILGTEFVQANTRTATSSADTEADEGMEEAADHSYSTSTNSTTGAKTYTFSYTGGVQSIALPYGQYKLEVWGAQGAANRRDHAGGYGGYAAATINITASSKTIYVVVGGAGVTSTGVMPSNTNYVGGGYNGGGPTASGRIDMDSMNQSGGGGGATHIATVSSVLSARSSNYSSTVYLVAGGGGGAGHGDAPTPAYATGCRGGGTSGGNAPSETNYTQDAHGKGGTQTAGGAIGSGYYTTEQEASSGYNRSVTAGSFGQGGRGAGRYGGGGGGGGGFFGGSGGLVAGGGGGSGYVNPNLTLSTGRTNTTSTQTGNGRAVITQINSVPTQGTTSTFTLNRTSYSTVKFDANESVSATYSLNCSDADTRGSREVTRANVAGIYMSAATTTPATVASNGNYWLEVSGLSTTSSTFSIRAKRYWSGTKTFYMQIRDYNTTYSASPGATKWISFKASCSAGSVAARARSESTYKFGASTSASPGIAWSSNNIYNPTFASGARQTLWLKDPIVSHKDTVINLTDLYTQKNAAGTAITLNSSTEEAALFSSSVTYGTTRYNKDTNAAQTISSATAGTNSSYFTTVSWANAVTTSVYNGSTVTANQTRGYTQLKIRGKANVPAGPYYYVMTITVQLQDKYSGTAQQTTTFDIVYRVDNTRPYLKNPAPALSVRSGATASIALSSICNDEDGNTLRIAAVKVPTKEFVSVDQYGNLRDASKDAGANAYYNVGTKASDAATSAATGTDTGFAANWIYKVSASGADNSLPSGTGEGNADVSYAGYYVNSARNTLYITGNKATRSLYKTNRGKESAGHFYILIRIVDAGDETDAGIWLPVGITVTTAAPTAANYPSVSGNAGDTFYFTPLSILQNGVYNGVGARKKENATSFNGGSENVRPFAYDRDNMLVSAAARNTSLTAANGITPPSALQATGTGVADQPKWAHRDPVFIATTAANAGNRALFADYTSGYGESADYAQGFKEFFTVKEVTLYAYNSVLSALPDSEIQWLINQNLIGFDGDYVTFKGLRIDLKKNTMGKYLSFYVNVIDSFATSQTAGTQLRIAVNVTNNASADGISARDNRSDVVTTPNYNTRVNSNYKNGSTYRETMDKISGVEPVVFTFRMRKGETVRVSPYDLFYSNDTFGVNGANEYANKDGAESGYNTIPDTTEYIRLLGGLNKNIAVYVADTPSATPTQKSDFHLDRLKISVTNPQVSGGGTNGTVMPSGTDYFEITAIRKTTGASYMSFYYEVVSDSGESIRAEIRVYVDNSLPEKRVAENKVFYLSATPTLGNSSSSETLSNVPAENGNGFYVINEETYNIREFTLDDLFEDVDGDNVIFVDSANIKIGTKDKNGEFAQFDADGNKYIRVYVGAGSGVRASNNSCLIIEGLSSTQGVPGGVWVQFAVSDNAIGTNASVDNVVYEFQVEVMNSTPAYAEMTGDNAMENTATGEGVKPQYVWKNNSQVSAVMEAVDDGTDTGAGIKANQKVYIAKLFGSGDVLNPDGSVAVETEKPMYIAANAASMGYYKAEVNKKLNGTGLAFNYTNEQVRYIAQDADANQGLALYGYSYTGQTTAASAPAAPSFRVHNANAFAANATADDLFGGEANANNAVAITRMYLPTDFPTSVSDQAKLDYYATNNIVQIFFFKADGTMIGPNITSGEDRLAANEATNWVIAFNFVGKPTESSFDVRIRLRDVNNKVSESETTGTITTGGFSEFSTSPILYKGPRTFANGAYGNPNANVTGLANGDGVFGFTAVHKTQGLINNFSYWSSTESKENVAYPGGNKDVSLNNVWKTTSATGVVQTYDGLTALGGNNAVQSNGLFRYDRIDVTQSNSAAVPISYFAWPAANRSNSNRGTAQSVYVWYDSFNGNIGTFNDNLATIANAITITDKNNSSWSGSDLTNGNNPYVKISLVQAQSVFGNANDKKNVDDQGNIIKPKKNYLYGQQRFFTEDISPTNGSGYFFEDTKGLLIAKNKVRSVGDLTLTVRLSVWVPDAQNGGFKKDPQYDPVSVSVPLYVGNTDLTLTQNDRTYDVTTSAEMASGATVALTTNYNTDYPEGAPANTAVVGSEPNDDQWRAYREDMYFLSSSIEGYKSYASPHSADTTNYSTRTATNMTEAELKHIQSVYATTTDSELKARIRAYFGVADTDVAGIKIATVGDKNTLTKSDGNALDINPYYTNYFTVSPTRADSKSITVMPNRITTFTPTGTTRTAIEAEAKTRGLSVRWVNANGGDSDIAYSYFYYPLKLIVYDRLTVGYSANTTRFAESNPDSLDDTSLDVITLNVRVMNAAPQVVTRNMSDTVTVRENDSSKEYDGKRISLAKGNRVIYNFTDLFSDADMVIDTTGSYKQEVDIKFDKGVPTTGIDADTGDYPHDWKESGDDPRLAKVEFLTATSASGQSGTNAYDPATKTGAVSCSLTETGVTVEVMNRAAGFKPSDVAAYIKLTFQDSHGESAACVIAVYIANQAPTLTSEAQATRNITMYTGDYFYMYATEFDEFMKGEDISQTVGSKTTSGYSGTYFDPKNVSTVSSKTLTGGVEQWSYHEGIRKPDGTFAGSIPNKEIKGESTAANGKLRNLGYMAIADDDAPWTLRFRSQGAVVCSSDMISVTTMNSMLYEGSVKGTSNEIWGDTAVLFRARGAVKDATVTITMYDGDSAIDGSENVNTLVYTFKITVLSTIPVTITQENQSEERVLGKYLDSSMKGRLSHIANEQDNTKSSYRLELYEGEEVTLRTKDFATDIDSGDEDRMYLLPISGDIPFYITSSDIPALSTTSYPYGTPANSTQHITLQTRQGVRNTQFTVSAQNFHNNSSDPNDMFDTVMFYICDPSGNTTAEARLIVLKVYVYPNKPAAVKDIATVDMYGVTEAQEKGAYAVRLVSKPGEQQDAIFADKDAGAALTDYKVSVYTYVHKVGEDGVGLYSNLSDVTSTTQLVARYTPATKTEAAKTETFFAGDGTETQYSAMLIEPWLGAVTFSEDGSTMYIVPKKSTRGLHYISGSDSATGISLYVKIEKVVDRANGTNYAPGSSLNPGYDASARMDVRISNSAPIMVGSTANNLGELANDKGVKVENRAYLWLEGTNGDSWTYYLHNKLSQKDEALFRDPDGDTVTVKSVEVARVYTLDEDGKVDNDFTNNATVRASANTAYATATTTKAYTLNQGKENEVTETYNALRISVQHKVDLPDSVADKNRTVYIDLRVTGQDTSSLTDTTVITLGIRNSVPVFRSENDEAVKKYNTLHSSYSYDEGTGNAELTLVLNKDDYSPAQFLSTNGVLRVPLTDFINDADVSSSASLNTERFTFADPGDLAGNRASVYDIRNDMSKTLWLGDCDSKDSSGSTRLTTGTFGVSTDALVLARKRFLVKVSDDSNTALIFTVNSYERGATEQLVLIAQDSSGAKTGMLTITLVIGNSAPIDKTALGEVSNRIVLAGSETGSIADATFKRSEFKVSDFVRDNNPDDNAAYGASPSELKTYLYISGYLMGDIEKDGEFKPDEGGDDMQGGVSQENLPLLNFSVNDNQTFTISPIAGRYGQQVITLTISDDGNTGSADSVSITVSITVQITKNPEDMKGNQVSVYWKRYKDVTASDIFDDPETLKDESVGFIVTGIVLSVPSNDITVSRNSVNGNWQIYGENINISGIAAVAQVIVGTSVPEDFDDGVKNGKYTVYNIPFTIVVNSNEKPVLKGKYATGMVLFVKGEFDDDGIAYVFIRDIFEDKEGDDLTLISASSKKSTLIDVIPDSSNARLQFKFKANGTSTVKVRIRDAVAEYTYEFKVGTNERSDPNFFIGIVSRIQGNPLIFIIIACAIVLLLIILILIIAAVRKKKRMREEIEALLVSEMELEEQMLKLAAGPSPTFYQAYGYLPPTPNAQQTNPNMMLGSGQGTPDPNAAIGLNPGQPNSGTPTQPNAQPPQIDDFSDDDL